MSKVLKGVGKALTFVGLAVATIATAGAAAPAFLSVGLGALSSAVGLSAATIATIGLVGGAALSAVGKSLGKGPTVEESAAGPRGQAYSDPNALGAFVFGETALPMAVVFEQNHGADNEFVSAVYAHAWHRIESYQSLHVDGEAVSFSGDNATGAWAGILTWRRKLGDGASQTALSLPGTAWPSTAKGAGVAHSAIVWNFKDQEKLTGGVPYRLVARARGARLYDPRLDSTAPGGSGSQRYNNPATWTWNNGNAALVALRYCIGERAANGKLIWGCGDAPGDIDMASFIAAANVADETVDGKPRFRLGGSFPLTNNHDDFFRQWEASTGGKIARIGGRRFCWLPHDDLNPVALVTDDDVVAEIGVAHDAGGDALSLVNAARGRFVSPAALYQAAPYPEVEEEEALAEDGRQRVLPGDFGWVQDVEIAERLARQAIRRSRFPRTWTFALGWRGALYPPFSILAIRFERETAGEEQLVRIIDKEMSADGVCLLTVQEEDAAIYDDTLPLGSPPSTEPIPSRLDRLGTLTVRRFLGQGALATKDVADYDTDVGGNRAPRAGLNLLPVEIPADYELVTTSSPAGYPPSSVASTSRRRIPLAEYGLAAGDPISASAELRNDVGGENSRFELRFRDSGGGIVETVNSGSTTNFPDWRRDEIAGAIIPAGAATVEMMMRRPTGSGQYRMRRGMVNVGPIPAPFSPPTRGAVWGRDVQALPIELTDERIAKAIASSGLINEAMIRAVAMKFNAAVSFGHYGASNLISLAAGGMTNMSNLSGLQRQFDTFGVAEITVELVLASPNSGTFIYGQLRSNGPGFGTRTHQAGMLYHTGDSNVRKRVTFTTGAFFQAGTYTFDFQWQAAGGTARCTERSMKIKFFKRATTSGLEDNGSGTGGGNVNWGTNPPGLSVP